MSSYKDKLKTVSETSFGNEAKKPKKKPAEETSSVLDTVTDMFSGWSMKDRAAKMKKRAKDSKNK